MGGYTIGCLAIDFSSVELGCTYGYPTVMKTASNGSRNTRKHQNKIGTTVGN